VSRAVASLRATALADVRYAAGVWHDPQVKPVLAVTGLAMEARIAAGPGVEVVCSGGDPARLRGLLEHLTPARYCAVISFGISGALDPALRPGDVVVATQIRSDTDTVLLAPALTHALKDRLEDFGRTATCAPVASAEAPVIRAVTKAALREQTGAAAVDTESHVAARFAADADVPVCAVRVISDPAERSLPALAARALRPDGRVNLPAVCDSLAHDPRQILLMIRAGLDARRAFAALRRVRGLLQLGLGFGGVQLR
jgi:adenosylhomocysteine nucleosidase